MEEGLGVLGWGWDGRPGSGRQMPKTGGGQRAEADLEGGWGKCMAGQGSGVVQGQG